MYAEVAGMDTNLMSPSPATPFASVATPSPSETAITASTPASIVAVPPNDAPPSKRMTAVPSPEPLRRAMIFVMPSVEMRPADTPPYVLGSVS